MQLKELLNQSALIKQMIITVVIITLAYISNKVLMKTLDSMIKTKGKTHKKQTIIFVLSSIIKFFIYFIASMIVLETFGVSTSSIVTIAGVGSVALGLGAQTLVKDVVSGLFILAENQYNIGDYIEISDYSGTVEALTLRTTILRTVDGELCIVPNGDVRGVKNYSKGYMNAIVDVAVPFQADVDFTINTIETWLQTYFLKEEMLEPAKLLGITEVNDSHFKVRIIGKTIADYKWSVERKLRKELLLLFRKEGIPINTNVVNVKNITDNRGRN